MQEQAEHLLVEITEQPIALCQLLKVANLVSGGGEAKIVISEGYVLLNNDVEYQKRKKVYDGDIIEFNGDVIQVSLVEYIPEQDFLAETASEPTQSEQAYTEHLPAEQTDVEQMSPLPRASDPRPTLNKAKDKQEHTKPGNNPHTNKNKSKNQPSATQFSKKSSKRQASHEPAASHEPEITPGRKRKPISF